MKLDLETTKALVSINQSHYARALNMGLWYFRRRFYTGEVTPTLAEVKQLAEALNIDYRDLLEEE